MAMTLDLDHMAMELAVKALGLVSTLQVLFMSPVQLKVLASAVLMLNQVILAIASQHMDMVMVMDSELMGMELDVLALGLVFTLLELSTNPDQLKVLASVVLMLSLAITLKITGQLESHLTAIPLATVATENVVLMLNQDTLDTAMVSQLMAMVMAMVLVV